MSHLSYTRLWCVRREQALPTSKQAKWRSQSNALRNAMQANRLIVDAQAQGKDIRTINFASVPQDVDDRWAGRRQPWQQNV